MAKIVIDARESGTSTGRYIDQLLIYLAKLKPNHQIVVLTKTHRLDFFRKQTPEFEVIESPHKEFTFAEQISFKKQLDGLNADLVHFGMVQQPLMYKGLVVTTIHDLTTLRFKNPAKNPLVLTIKQQVYKIVIKSAVRKSRYIIAISQYVKDDLINFTGYKGDKIKVIYESADPITEAAEPIDQMIGKPFIMYVGRPTPHKNLERLIEAFVELQSKRPELWLVLAGKKDLNYQKIEDDVKLRGLKNIYFTGFVSDGQLRWLYENCRAYVFPSLSEGFGLPPLEAMAHGAPVVSSNATCLPEINGDAAHYFDPLDTSDMAQAIDDVLTDELLRSRLIDSGFKQLKKYSWQTTAEQTLDIYNKALTRGKNNA